MAKQVITLHAPSTHVSRLELILRDLRHLGLEPIVVSYPGTGDKPSAVPVGSNDVSYSGNGNWGKGELLRWIDDGFTLFSHTAKTTDERMLIRLIDEWVFIVFGQNYYRPYEDEPDRWRPQPAYATVMPGIEVVQRYHFAQLPLVDFKALMAEKQTERGYQAHKIAGSFVRSHLSYKLGLEPGVAATLPSQILVTWPEAVQSIGWDGSGHSREEEE